LNTRIQTRRKRIVRIAIIPGEQVENLLITIERHLRGLVSIEVSELVVTGIEIARHERKRSAARHRKLGLKQWSSSGEFELLYILKRPEVPGTTIAVLLTRVGR